MKRGLLFLSLLVLFSTYWVQAKKVKFAVDMSGQTIMSTGVHVTGNFQALAGFPGGDWQSNTTRCLQEGTTDVYSVVVDIPANRIYQYKFVNGDQFYEVEFVPEESRVNYEFNDNRWIYVDSLGSDTFTFPVILFGGNAPAGKVLFRVSADAKELPSLSSEGLFMSINLGSNLKNMDNLFQKYYDVLLYVDSAFEVNYRFANGNSLDSLETVPTACSYGLNRSVLVTVTKVAASVCFGSCEPCSATGISEISKSEMLSMFPNPAKGKVQLLFANMNSCQSIELRDLCGKLIKNLDVPTNNNLIELDIADLSNGLYVVSCLLNDGNSISKMLFVE